MGTRAATLTCKDGREIYRHYRQYDGYPDSHGADLAAAMLANQPIDDATYLDELENMGCEDESSTYTEHGDIAFLYQVDLDRDAKITIWDADWNHGYSRIMSTAPIFEGTPTELLEKFMPDRLEDLPKPLPKIHVALKEVDCSSGLTLDDCQRLVSMIDDEQVYPIEAVSHKVESSAIGFISARLANELSFEYDAICATVTAVIDDMSLEREDHVYTVGDTNIYMDR